MEKQPVGLPPFLAGAPCSTPLSSFLLITFSFDLTRNARRSLMTER